MPVTRAVWPFKMPEWTPTTILHYWNCPCGETGYMQTDRSAVEEFGRLHESDCPERVQIVQIELQEFL